MLRTKAFSRKAPLGAYGQEEGDKEGIEKGKERTLGGFRGQNQRAYCKKEGEKKKKRREEKRREEKRREEKRREEKRREEKRREENDCLMPQVAG